MKYRVVKLLENCDKNTKFTELDKIEGVHVKGYWTLKGAKKNLDNGILFDRNGIIKQIPLCKKFDIEFNLDQDQTIQKKFYNGGWVRSDYYGFKDYGGLSVLAGVIENYLNKKYEHDTNKTYLPIVTVGRNEYGFYLAIKDDNACTDIRNELCEIKELDFSNYDKSDSICLGIYKLFYGTGTNYSDDLKRAEELWDTSVKGYVLRDL